MSDYISRGEVRAKLTQYVSTHVYIVLPHIQKIVDDMPSADVRENIHGEWTKIQSGDKDFPESIVCSKCKNENSHLDFNEHKEPIGKVFVTSKFCPNCGADMRGDKE
jgi:hypothetical protein